MSTMVHMTFPNVCDISLVTYIYQAVKVVVKGKGLNVEVQASQFDERSFQNHMEVSNRLEGSNL